jgi:hypothetical protein
MLTSTFVYLRKCGVAIDTYDSGHLFKSTFESAHKEAFEKERQPLPCITKLSGVPVFGKLSVRERVRCAENSQSLGSILMNDRGVKERRCRVQRRHPRRT